MLRRLYSGVCARRLHRWRPVPGSGLERCEVCGLHRTGLDVYTPLSGAVGPKGDKLRASLSPTGGDDA